MLAGAGDLTYVRVHNASSLALPEKIATAVAEFIAGPLVDNPYRVGHPIHDEYAGQYSRRGLEWRIRYLTDEQTHTVVVLDVSHRLVTYGT